MGRVSDTIPNLINGISQQPPQLRLPTQAEAQVNCASNIADGLGKRTPTLHIAQILTSLQDDAFIHFIDRDADEKYLVVVEDDGIPQVWDLMTGASKTVNYSGSPDYLAVTGAPNSVIRATTVADYTFLVSREETVALDTTTAATRPYEALINVQQGQYGRTYNIDIDGTNEATYTTADGLDANEAEDIDTVNIATELYNDLVTGGFNTAPWSVTRYGNAIYLKNTSTDFDVAIEDGLNGEGMKVAKNRIQEFSDLPVFGPEDFVIEIAGDESTEFDNYWVKAVKNGTNDSQIIWEECPEPGVKIDYDADTMPHQLVRETDGTFTYEPATWNSRQVGDATLAPPASFVGFELRDIFFHKNRLGLLCEENVILSAAGDFFDFWRGTLTTILDDDPIDISTTHTKVSIMERAVPFDGKLVLFSKNTQFELSADGYLSPATTTLTPKSNFESDPLVAPAAAGAFIYFANQRGDWASIYEYHKDALDNVYKANEATAHVPKYIPSDITRFTVSPSVDQMFVLSDNDQTALWTYKFHWFGEDKAQSAFHKWTFPGVTRIYGMEIIESTLYLVVKRTDTKIYLESIDLAPGAVDTGTTYMTYLDRKVDSDDLAAPSYDSVADETTFTLSYSIPSSEDDLLVVCSREVVDDPDAPGTEYTINSITGTTIVVDGDVSGTPLWFGYKYTASYEFSPIYVREQTAGGAEAVVTGARLQLHYLTLEYAATGYFKVTVTPEYGSAYEYVYNNTGVGQTNPIELARGKFNVPILSKSDTVSIVIESDSFLPMFILNAEWNGQLVLRSRRI